MPAIKIDIFDLDKTVLDSSHRYRALPNGDIDLNHWRDMSKPSEILKDKPLPLAEYMRDCYRKRHHVAICTSRVMSEADFEVLEKHDLKFHSIMFRETDSDQRGCVDMKREKIRSFLNQKAILPIHLDKVWLFDDHLGVVQMANQMGLKGFDGIALNNRMLHYGQEKLFSND